VKTTYYVGLWLASVVAAVMTGAFGGWMADWATGNTVSAQVGGCYQHNGWNEYPYARCDGDWHHTWSDGKGNTTYVASGPVVGVKADRHARVVNSDGKLAGSYAGTYFAVLNGDAAVVVPRSHLLLGPAGLVTLIACGIAFIVVRRRDAPDNLAGWPAPLREVEG
jgi:hypothetical protein